MEHGARVACWYPRASVQACRRCKLCSRMGLPWQNPDWEIDSQHRSHSPGPHPAGPLVRQQLLIRFWIRGHAKRRPSPPHSQTRKTPTLADSQTRTLGDWQFQSRPWTVWRAILRATRQRSDPRLPLSVQIVDTLCRSIAVHQYTSTPVHHGRTDQRVVVSFNRGKEADPRSQPLGSPD